MATFTAVSATFTYIYYKGTQTRRQWEKNNQIPDVIRDTEIQPSCPGFSFVQDTASHVVVQANPGHSGWISLSQITFGDRLSRVTELKDSYIALEPLFTAEDDREIMKIKRRNRDMENELMKNVPDWETGTLWGTPIYYNKKMRYEIPESFAELNAHSPALKDSDHWEIR
ncbi:hypothetical protein FSP39_012780 [Pinctada imbricata]|uniref:NADH dehydrogenase [ubiquinone] 1 alpha subcomplex subunit 13 n=1 Tax=Pinctada imbricata TaxID=66713 RepID=A0AA88YE94_PINIB|nr:hypothetical protein FSP39_012780 [Pinctada imbricata]